ncbi:MAG: hypothetical protein M3461_06145 [Pseudomonadota bacterium]|nr:hypothetical protein [Pseudomonadota bacterium]
MDLLTPTLKGLLQKQHLDLPASGWRLQYEVDEWEEKIREIWKLHIEVFVPKTLSNEFSAIHAEIYTVVRTPEPDPDVIGRVYSHESGELNIYIPVEKLGFQSLVSSLQAKLDQTHSFVIRITTKKSLAELKTMDYIVITDVLFDFVNKEDDTMSQNTARHQEELDVLMSIRLALWLIFVLGVIALINRAFA